MKEELLGSCPRILISRLSSLGDTVHGFPVLCSLRERYPEAHIGWMVEDWNSDLLKAHDALDEVITVARGLLSPYPRHSIPGKIPALWGVREKLRASHFDVALDLQGRTKSALAGWLSGAKVRIGYRDVDGRELSRFFNNRLVTPRSRHVVDRSLELLEPLGVSDPTIAFRVPLGVKIRNRVQGLLSSMGIHGHFVVFGIGAGQSARRWPPDRYAEVASRIVDRHRISVLVNWVGEEERSMAQRVAEASREKAKILPATTVSELAALLNCARLFVGSDTGPLHLAAALGTPCVGLYGPTDPGRTGPYGVQHTVVGRVASGPAKAMVAIQSTEVAGAVDRILEA